MSGKLVTVAGNFRRHRRRWPLIGAASAAASITVTSRARISAWPSLTASTRRGCMTVSSASARSVSLVILLCRNKKLRYRRGTARRAVSVEILSSAAQLYAME